MFDWNLYPYTDIDHVNMDWALDKIRELNSAINNILQQMPVLYDTLGNNVDGAITQALSTSEFAKSMQYHTVLPDNNLNNITDIGIYWHSDGAAYSTNGPTGVDNTSYLLTVLNGGTTERSMQIISVLYSGQWYARSKAGSPNWGAWNRIIFDAELTTELNTAMRYHTALTDNNLNNITDIGVYWHSDGAAPSTNGPANTNSAAYLLTVLNAGTAARSMQIVSVLYTGRWYVRSKAGSPNWGAWKQILFESDLPHVAISYVDSANYDINLGDFTARFVHQNDAGINVDSWNIRGIKANNHSNNVLVTYGTDILGPIREYQQADFMGGLHGDEIADYIAVFVDGNQYNFANHPNLIGNSITFVQHSTLYHVDTKTPCVERFLTVVFTHNKITVSNNYKFLESITIDEACNGGLIAVTANYARGIYQNNLVSGTLPASNPGNYFSGNQFTRFVTSIGNITHKILQGQNLPTYTGGLTVYDGENPVRYKDYFFLVRTPTVFSANDWLCGTFEYEFDD